MNGSDSFAVDSAILRLVGGCVEGVVLCRAMEFQGDNDAWWSCTTQAWMDGLGLSRRQVEGARRKLRELGYLQERLAGLPAKLHYKVNVDAVLSDLGGIPAISEEGEHHGA